MSLSIKQIAALAGVSRGTVDRALNGRGGINPATKRQIIELAEGLGYRTNRAGKMLGIRKNPLRIGIQMPSVGNEFFLDVQSGIRQAESDLADFGLSTVIRSMKGFSADQQIAQIRELLADGIHGLAFVPVDHPSVALLLDELAASGLPVMTFNTDLTSGRRLGYVGNDYDQSGVIAAGMLGLIADGRSIRALTITGSRQVLGHQLRIAGFNRIISQNYPSVRVLDIQENQDDEDVSYQLVRSALQRWPELNALYLTAGGVSGACRALIDFAGSRPIKVICFDLTPGTLAYHRSGLITASIGQEPFQQGYLPVKYLFEYLLDGTKPPDCTLTRNEIIIREHLDAGVQAESTVPPQVRIKNQEVTS